MSKRKSRRPMHILYHGTSKNNLSAILAKGLLPRMDHGGKSNFEGKIESKPEFVYLTDAWPVFYGYNSTPIEQKEFAVIKVLVFEDEMLPDEDFLGFLKEMEDRVERKRKLREECDLEGAKRKKTTHDFISECHPKDRPELAMQSLVHYGTVATGAITPDRILDHCLLPLSDFALLTHLGADSNLAANAAFVALREISRNKYRDNLERLFDLGWNKLKNEIEEQCIEQAKHFENLKQNGGKK